MRFSKWTELELEYSAEEFIISFIVAALVWYLFIGPLFFQSYLLGASLIFGIVVGILWAYSRDRELFIAKPKKK